MGEPGDGVADRSGGAGTACPFEAGGGGEPGVPVLAPAAACASPGAIARKVASVSRISGVRVGAGLAAASSDFGIGVTVRVAPATGEAAAVGVIGGCCAPPLIPI